jgi:hypothetical protein
MAAHPSRVGPAATFRQALVAALLAGGLAACEPTDDRALNEPPPDPPGEPAPDVVGRPDGTGLSTLPELLAHSDQLAGEWQPAPVLAEILVRLADREWAGAHLLYLAAEADRFLAVRLTADGVAQERPTLATLGLEAIGEEGIAAIPPFPGDVIEPRDLADAAEDALRGCGFGWAEAVLYATGAPAAWDGQAWAEPPGWTATVLAVDGAVTVDPRTGDADPQRPCVALPNEAPAEGG